ncbi:MAG: phosphoribosylanthranilate isomerase [Methylobacteriaceae bacterium]|nr:phosphoribosylanthranilate isomerase [Methylobacteriaceae bacterium]
MSQSQTVVKICGLSSAATLDAALDSGADMVGFVFFDPSPRNLSPGQARALGASVRGRAQKVALTVDASDAKLDAIVAALAPDILQLHGKETPERVQDIRAKFGIPVMKAIGIASRADLAKADAYIGVADTLLFDAKPAPEAVLPGGNGRAFDWSILKDFAAKGPWMLSGGLDPTNVADALTATGARGVDVSSGVERAPGVKDPARIAAFVAAVRALSPGAPSR